MSVGAVNKNTGDRIPTAGMPAIDDALDLTSVNPVQNAVITAALANKQDKTDNSLQTTDKTVVGAINEHEGDIGSLKSGLTNVDVTLSVPENTGKNVLPTTLDWLKASNTVGTWYGNVYTKDSVTFTVATDSKGRISSITVNGTASGANTIIVLAAGRYDEWSGMILNGTPTNDSDYYIRIEKDGSPYTAYAVNIGEDPTISSGIVGNDVKAFIKVGQGKTAENAVFTPMIRDARITDPTFAPYIPSVESRIEALVSETTNTYDFSTPSGYNAGGRVISDKFGNMVILRFVDYIPTAPSGKVELFGGLPQATNGQTTQFFNIGNQTSFKVLIDTDGKLYSYYNADKTGSTDVYNGQLVYFTK